MAQSDIDLLLIDQNVYDIRDWMNENIRYYMRQDDSFIRRFLRVCQFDLDKTKKLICRYYDVRHGNPHLFNWSLTSTEFFSLLGMQAVCYFIIDPELNAPTVIILKIAAFDVQKHSLESYKNAIVLMLETYMEHPKVNLQDIHVVIDCKDISWSFISKLTPQFLAVCSKLQMNMPIGYKNVHIFNGNIFLKIFLGLLKCFMNRDFVHQIVYHGSDINSVHKYIPKEYLPFEYDGTAGSEQHFVDANLEFIENGKTFNHENAIYGYDKFPKS